MMSFGSLKHLLNNSNKSSKDNVKIFSFQNICLSFFVDIHVTIQKNITQGFSRVCMNLTIYCNGEIKIGSNMFMLQVVL